MLELMFLYVIKIYRWNISHANQGREVIRDSRVAKHNKGCLVILKFLYKFCQNIAWDTLILKYYLSVF